MTAASRKSSEIPRPLQRRIERGLEQWAKSQDFVALRTRAFVYLLWDGTVRTKAALALDVQDLTEATALRVGHEVRRSQGKSFSLSDRTRAALAEYLQLARREGRLAQMRGPLFLSTRPGSKRLSQRTAVQAWHSFLREYAPDAPQHQLDDVVFTGRLAFLRAAKGDAMALAEHAQISITWANEYRSHLQSGPTAGAREVLARLAKARAQR